MRIPDDQPIVLPPEKTLEERRDAYQKERSETRKETLRGVWRVLLRCIILTYSIGLLAIAYDHPQSGLSPFVAIGSAWGVVYCVLWFYAFIVNIFQELDEMDRDFYALDDPNPRRI